MALDALAIRCLTNELSLCLTGGRIDKIHQPERDEIMLHIRTPQKQYKLVLSASASHPRAHLTSHTKSNPMTPPMFCMLLRKHIGSAKIIRISQPGFERIIQFDLESYDELGDLTTKHLLIEIMGRFSNIILTADDCRIIDSIRHVDYTISSVRQVLPGGAYVLPPEQEKPPLISDALSSLQLDFSQSGTRLDKLLLSSIAGISPLTAREIVYRAFHTTSLLAGELDEQNKTKLMDTILAFADEVKKNTFSPCIIRTTERLLDFSAIAIRQYETAAEVLTYDSFNEVLQQFYTGRDQMERMKQKSADLIKLLHTNLERCAKKLVLQQKTLSDSEQKDQYKIAGDLLTSNLYRIAPGEKEVMLENYYEPSCPSLSIKLDPTKTPSQNAQLYYKKYNKAKTAEVEMVHQIKHTKSDLSYLESTLVAVQGAQTEADLNEIRAELAREGYINRRTQAKKAKQSSTSKPLHYKSSDGFDIYVGKNNTQNDYLTLKFANSGDLWFHTKNIHGCHAIIKLGVDKDVPKSTLIEAATLAAYYSKARNSSQVPVDYTSVKNVKKPSGAKPGMVIYDHYNTIYVTPKEPRPELTSS
jgi:predicted ribosome quality control (RQC) complex YloA/Tae2 family protein